MHVESLKALHGLLMPTLSLCNEQTKDFTSMGFELNPCNSCAVNKMTSGKQMTIVWHVDDLKTSHVNKRVNDEFLEWLKIKHENSEIGNVKATQGKMHDFFGMKLDCTEDGIVKADVVECITSMVTKFSMDLKKMRLVSSSAADHLHKVRDDIQKLSKTKAEIFHGMVARGPFVTK